MRATDALHFRSVNCSPFSISPIKDLHPVILMTMHGLLECSWMRALSFLLLSLSQRTLAFTVSCNTIRRKKTPPSNKMIVWLYFLQMRGWATSFSSPRVLKWRRVWNLNFWCSRGMCGQTQYTMAPTLSLQFSTTPTWLRSGKCIYS